MKLPTHIINKIISKEGLVLNIWYIILYKKYIGNINKAFMYFINKIIVKRTNRYL